MQASDDSDRRQPARKQTGRRNDKKCGQTNLTNNTLRRVARSAPNVRNSFPNFGQTERADTPQGEHPIESYSQHEPLEIKRLGR